MFTITTLASCNAHANTAPAAAAATAPVTATLVSQRITGLPLATAQSPRFQYLFRTALAAYLRVDVAVIAVVDVQPTRFLTTTTTTAAAAATSVATAAVDGPVDTVAASATHVPFGARFSGLWPSRRVVPAAAPGPALALTYTLPTTPALRPLVAASAAPLTGTLAGKCTCMKSSTLYCGPTRLTVFPYNPQSHATSGHNPLPVG